MQYSRHILFAIFFLFANKYCNAQDALIDKMYVDLSMRKTDSLLSSPKNGYSTGTITKLQTGIDSMNSRFEKYYKGKKYYARQQAHAHYIYLNGMSITSVLADINKDISLAEFCKKYPSASVKKDQLIVKLLYNNKLRFEAISFDYTHTRAHEINDAVVKGKWIYESTDGSEGFKAFYLPEGLESKPLPEKYARMVTYINYMTDTSYWLFLPEAAESWLYQKSDPNKAISAFLTYVARKTGRPDITNTINPDAYKRWYNNRYNVIDSVLLGTTDFKNLFAAATSAAMKRGYATDEMEDYIERYNSKENALLLKRGRKIIVGCGNDYRAHYRIHNMQRLAVETGNIQLYIRCSFFIFDALGGVNEKNKSYVSQLEQLHLSPVGVLFGSCLYAEQPSDAAAYYPRTPIYQLTDHIATSDNVASFNNELLAAISNPELDNYNRILLCGAYIQYISHIKGHEDFVKHTELLKKAMATLPDYYAGQIKMAEEIPYIR